MVVWQGINFSPVNSNKGIIFGKLLLEIDKSVRSVVSASDLFAKSMETVGEDIYHKKYFAFKSNTNTNRAVGKIYRVFILLGDSRRFDTRLNKGDPS